jgi:hypothetical protein
MLRELSATKKAFLRQPYVPMYIAVFRIRVWIGSGFYQVSGSASGFGSIFS